MIDEVRGLLDHYTAWLRDKTLLRDLDSVVEVTTPYLDRHNDYMQIYIARSNGTYLLSDDGYVLHDLRISGCDIDSPKRHGLLTMTLNGFGVRVEDDALVVKAGAGNFPSKKHNLIQAMLAVNDLFYLADPSTPTLFVEDVTTWLESNQVRYTPKIKLTGKSGYDHVFDFVIPKSPQKPERIVKALNRLNRNSVQAVLLACVDTLEVRPADSSAYAFLNDAEGEPSEAAVEALGSYDVKPVLWSRRQEVLEDIAA